LLARSHGYSGGTGNWSTHNFYHADGNGNITYVVNSSQGLAASYRYDPFGNTLASSGSLAGANGYRFLSKELHVRSGLYYYGYRFYDPSTQRWPNRDPLGDAGSLPVILLVRQEAADLNLYRFLSNDPLDNFDPDGLKDRWYAPGSVKNNCDKPVPAVDLDNKKCTIVPAKGGKSPGFFTDWDFAKLPDGKWYKIGVGRLTVPKDGKYKGTPADKDTSDACERIYQDYLKGQEKKAK
jgi:RHS repeat-associated protein